MNPRASRVPADITIHSIRQELKSFARPERRVAVRQILNTFLPYFALWAVLVFMVKSNASVVWMLPVMVVAALLLTRIFILLHDCAHGSFFPSSRANLILGYVAGFLTFTPFTYWKNNHLVHHGCYADLDRRGVGDIWTLTVAEYRALSPFKRFAYRFYRNPLVFLGIGPGYSFLITQRYLHNWQGKAERFSARVTNVAIVVIIVMASLTMGLKTYLIIQLPIILLAGAIGVWLFYVQHQFEGVYWSRHEDWDPVKAALDGSSYYKLPKWLQWFTGSIGLHHVHHVLPRIPNYKLQESYDASAVMQSVPPLNIRESLGSLRLNLWDEERQKLVGFRAFA